MFSNRKQVFFAAGGSVLLHVLILFSWAFGVRWLPGPKPPEKPPPPIHLEIVKAEETPPPMMVETPTPTPVAFIDTSSRDPADRPPEVAKFQSSQDTHAASMQPGTGEGPLPSQAGKKMPAFAFDTTAYQAGEAPALAAAAPASAPPPQIQPAATPATPPPSTPTPAPTHTPVPDDEFGLPPPTPNPEDAGPTFDPAFRSPDSTMPDRPTVAARSANASNAAGFQAYEQTSSMNGNINKRGANSVDAIGTPEGNYRSMVISAIKRKWSAYYYARPDLVAVGEVHIHFIIDRNGRVTVPRVISNTSNEGLATVSLRALLDAAIPPMSPPVVAAMRGELSVDLVFDSQ